MAGKASKKRAKNSSGKTSKNRRPSTENFHVVPRVDGWAVRSEGSSRATSIHSSQREAIDAARKLAKQTSTQLVIHGRDGRIKERASYGSDPFPPREPRKILYPSSTPRTSREAIRRAVSEAIRETREGRDVA
jgi:uncharacterized protein DUF2188